MKCLWCNNTSLNSIYDVKTSKIGANVHHCDRCNLVQSHYSSIENKHRYKSISSDADWGNVRHGKGVRLKKSIDCLKSILDEENVSRMLDVGSNRGHFCKWVSENYLDVMIDMIEPDSNVSNYQFKYDTLISDRIENVELENKYDLIYCCQTLEHLEQLHDFFDKMYKSCTKYLFIDVPNVEILKKRDQYNIEEFFIDKHVIHLSSDVLKNMVTQYGFEIVNDCSDDYNLTIVCKKLEPKKLELDMNWYAKSLNDDRKVLEEKASRINEMMKREKVVIYGATRIYDALVRYGNLNTSDIYYLVDDFLELPNIYKFDKLKEDPPDTVVILARSSIDIIKDKLSAINLSTTTFEVI
jgi:2-polyprenyl-3-methyl-5-hydroxy-6-metoxy-1,4-benzoquinol methylase